MAKERYSKFRFLPGSSAQLARSNLGFHARARRKIRMQIKNFLRSFQEELSIKASEETVSMNIKGRLKSALALMTLFARLSEKVNTFRRHIKVA
jgi:hypothetical protein